MGITLKNILQDLEADGGICSSILNAETILRANNTLKLHPELKHQSLEYFKDSCNEFKKCLYALREFFNTGLQDKDLSLINIIAKIDKLYDSSRSFTNHIYYTCINENAESKILDELLYECDIVRLQSHKLWIDLSRWHGLYRSHMISKLYKTISESEAHIEVKQKLKLIRNLSPQKISSTLNRVVSYIVDHPWEDLGEIYTNQFNLEIYNQVK